eukprot:TRINITY_DN4520_c1_g2_i1.p1 TRINITY_DN4520_c1_g2~~TRINITY_DN4520_c1_g2_i1.p1  ORF type:complete len:106 (-),score=22.63 TRINITY_DN4520_c1_g2_i1:159-476(-)
MSSLPKALLVQMKELKSVAKNGQQSGSEDLPGKARNLEYPSLLARRGESNNFQTSSTARAAGLREAEHEKKFSSVPPNLALALSSLQAFQARQQRIASRDAAFVV